MRVCLGVVYFTKSHEVVFVEFSCENMFLCIYNIWPGRFRRSFVFKYHHFVCASPLTHAASVTSRRMVVVKCISRFKFLFVNIILRVLIVNILFPC